MWLGAAFSEEPRFEDVYGSAVSLNDVWMGIVMPHAASRL